MEAVATLTLVVYYCALGLLVVFGLQRLWLAVSARPGRATTAERVGSEPIVTVQLPLYNERYVTERLLRSVAGLSYPREKLEIQVLDDSDDVTRDIVDRVVGELAADGVPISVLRRDRRDGFKAAALAFGLETARGELIAVFDADFVPSPSFLEDTVAMFADSRVGMVQTRWAHLNRSTNWLTRAQAVLLDGHFAIEQPARATHGRFFNFNGTAGIWRKSAIVDAGGWSSDTLTEDLDLSYRAQLKGWEFRYRTDIESPAELPADIDGLRSQQHRWAKGSIECLIKLALPVWRCDEPLPKRLGGLMHLSANLSYLAALTVAVLLPLVPTAEDLSGMRIPAIVDLAMFGLGTLAVFSFYAAAERTVGRGGWKTPAAIVFAMCVDAALSLLKSRAVLEALAGRRSAFVRTPKRALVDGTRVEGAAAYNATRRASGLGELTLAFWTAGGALAAIARGGEALATTPFLVAYSVGFGVIAAVSLSGPLAAPQAQTQSATT